MTNLRRGLLSDRDMCLILTHQMQYFMRQARLMECDFMQQPSRVNLFSRKFSILKNREDGKRIYRCIATIRWKIKEYESRVNFQAHYDCCINVVTRLMKEPESRRNFLKAYGVEDVVDNGEEMASAFKRMFGI